MSGDSERRLEELEIRAAFQDDLIERLNQVVARQDRELLALRRRHEELESRLRELAEAGVPAVSPGGHEIPPHY